MKISPDTAVRNRLVVSIINYKTPDLTRQCVRSVLDDMGTLDAHVVVVDNYSGDGSDQNLSDWIAGLDEPEKVTLVCSPENTGFSGGHNQGFAVRAADYYLVLNSDAVLRPGFLAEMLKVADSQPQIGLFAPRIDYDDGEQQVSLFRFPNPFSELARGARTGIVSRFLEARLVPLDMPPTPIQIEWASFACILLRGIMVDQVGPMDEGYFLYFEDVEYCARARKAGWRIAYVPDARAVHFRGGSGPVKALAKAAKRLPPYYYASRTRLFYQLYGHIGLFAGNLAWVAGRAVAHLRLLTGRRVPPSNAHEARDIWLNFLSPLGDRHAAKDKT